MCTKDITTTTCDYKRKRTPSYKYISHYDDIRGVTVIKNTSTSSPKNTYSSNKRVTYDVDAHRTNTI
jgi:hypothetical protein